MTSYEEGSGGQNQQSSQQQPAPQPAPAPPLSPTDSYHAQENSNGSRQGYGNEQRQHSWEGFNQRRQSAYSDSVGPHERAGQGPNGYGYTYGYSSRSLPPQQYQQQMQQGSYNQGGIPIHPGLDNRNYGYASGPPSLPRTPPPAPPGHYQSTQGKVQVPAVGQVNNATSVPGYMSSNQYSSNPPPAVSGYPYRTDYGMSPSQYGPTPLPPHMTARRGFQGYGGYNEGQYGGGSNGQGGGGGYPNQGYAKMDDFRPYYPPQQHPNVAQDPNQHYAPGPKQLNEVRPAPHAYPTGPGAPQAQTQAHPVQYVLKTIKPKRKRASSAQVNVLNAVFARTLFPSTALRVAIGKELGMSPRTVQIWFQNKRQAFRTQRVKAGLPTESSPQPSSAQSRSDSGPHEGPEAYEQPVLTHGGAHGNPEKVTEEDPANHAKFYDAREDPTDDDEEAAWEAFKTAVRHNDN